MKSIKFILVNLLLDSFILILLVFIYVKGFSGSIILREIPVAIVAGFIIFVAIRNIGNRPIGELIGEVALTIGLFMWYVQATKNDYDILASNMKFIGVIRGLLLVICFLCILSFIKRYVNSFLKSAEIFYHAYEEEDYSIFEAFIGALSRFKSTIGIPIFNKMIRGCVGDIVGLAQESPSKDTESATDGETAETDGFFSKLRDSKLGKASKWMLTYYMDYIDECILMYCYKHKELSMFKASVTAIGIFLFNGLKIIEQMAVVIIVQFLLKVALTVGAILMILCYHLRTLKQFLFIFIIVKMIGFLIQDAIIEPLMLQKILKTFAGLDSSGVDCSMIIEKFPILQKIKRLQGSKEGDLDDEDNRDKEEPVTAEKETNDVNNTSAGEAGDLDNEEIFRREQEEQERNNVL